MAKFGFDVTEVEVSERGDFEVMPKGEYTLKATEAEEKKTSKGDGSYIACTFEVSKGEFTGRKVWQNFNINNPSDKAEKIGREQVAGWARACGKPNAQDTDDLLERNFQAKLGIEKGTGGYSDKNKIDSFLLPGAESKSTGRPPAKPASKFDDPEEEKKPEPKSEPASEGKKRQPWD